MRNPLRDSMRAEGLLDGHSDRCTCNVCIRLRNGARTKEDVFEGHSSRCTCNVCIRRRNPSSR
jgi:hypothetical protein